jgi:uncharacterized protein Yka (UPF0111/DUF47 family)
MAKTQDPTDAIVRRATAFTDALLECTGLLPDLVDAHGEDPERFAGLIDRIHRIESRCDSLARDLREFVVDRMTPNFTGYYLLADELVAAINDADEIASRAEHAAMELDAMGSVLSEAQRQRFETIAAISHEAAQVFAAALEAYVDRLGREGGEGTDNLTDSLDRIRGFERDCDLLKYEVIDRAFEEGVDVEAVATHRLVVSLDSVPNAVEDGADRLATLSSREV